MTEIADKSKDSRGGDIAKVFEPSDTISVVEPTVVGVPASSDQGVLRHLDSEMHAIFGESEDAVTEDEQSLVDKMVDVHETSDSVSVSASVKDQSTLQNESGTDHVCRDDVAKSQEMAAVTLTSGDELEKSGISEIILEDNGERENGSELPENPEVSARLTNLSLRHAGARPAWFDFEPLALSGRTRQCRQIFWRIASDQRAQRKQMMALLAPSGMGKTAFLAELYAMLEHAPHNVLTLAPGVPSKAPFQALKNILEQRFYISGDAPFECISQYVTGAVKGIIGGGAGDCAAQEVIQGVLALWRGLDEDTENMATETAPETDEDAAMNDAKSSGVSKRRGIQPPALATQVTAMDTILDAHRKSQEVLMARGNSDGVAQAVRIQAIPKPERSNGVPPIMAFKRTEIQSCSSDLDAVHETSADSQDVSSDNVVQQLELNDIVMVEGDASVEDNDVNEASGQDVDVEDRDLAGDESGVSAVNNAAEEACDPALTTDAEGAILSDEDHEIAALCELYQGLDVPTARRVVRLEQPLIRLLEADLKKNAQVWVLDDVERYDLASLLVIARVFEGIHDVPLTVFMTSSDVSALPVCLRCCDMEDVRLRALSDRDLSHLTHHILKKLSATREKMIVPKDMCLLIAQRSFGSPKRVQELTLKHFTPDSMMHWNEAIEQLHHEALPRALAIELVRRIRECDATARTILQFAAYLNAPFTASTIECILSSWEDRESLGVVDCHHMLKRLREEGYLERLEDGIGSNKPTYVFKHECERLVIAGTTPKPMRHHVYGTAAQWYALNNASEAYDESIGDLWRSHRSYHEACRYYERAAYRARRQGQLQKAWPLFRKLLKTLPQDCMAQRVQYSLDGASIAFRLGHIDEAFRLCRLSSHHALKLSAYNQAARAHVLMASMLIELGSVRHVLRYTARANSLLNCEGDTWTRCHLYNVLTRRALMMGQHAEAVKWHTKAWEGVKHLHLQPNDRLLLQWTDAEIEAKYGDPVQAAKVLEQIVDQAGILGCSRLQALAWRSMGHLYARILDIDKALEALNVALGMAQEMNDIILHANLLSDISEGALALEARRTARSTTEACLGLAQQTHQKALIARCLANTACLQISGGLYDKAMRTLRKAHKSAVALRSVALWTRILGLLAMLYAIPDNPQYNPSRANEIYRRLSNVYERYHMPLERAQLLPQYAEFLLMTHQNMAALNAYRAARGIYIRLGLDDLAEKIQQSMDKIMRDQQLNHT